jgi:hypothetical protein
VHFFFNMLFLFPEIETSISCGISFFCFSSCQGREIGNEKLIGILDLQQITYRNIDARGLITGFQFLQVNVVFFL